MAQSTTSDTIAKADAGPLLVPIVYGLCISLASALMFLVEPFVAKILLPNLGGGPNVWNTCVMFFQITLLAGYLYAHLIAKRLRVKLQIIVQLLVVWLSVAILPIRTTGPVPPVDHPFLWLLSVLATIIGAVFFAISTTAPLMQSWYARSRAPGSRDPYFLYAASNLGGVIGLLSYPFLVEPNLTLAQQSQYFSYGYYFYAALMTACAFLLWRRRSDAIEAGGHRVFRSEELSASSQEGAGTNEEKGESRDRSAAGREESGRPNEAGLDGPALRRHLLILALTAIPSGLVLALTTYVTSELSAIPLFWMVPLLAYLLSFIIAFGRTNPVALKLSCGMVPAAVLILLIFMTSQYVSEMLPVDYWLAVAMSVHVLAVFLICIACHGSVAERRPEPAKLTAYFLTISIGGVLGSSFSTLLSPVLFKSGEEYPLLLIASVLILARVPWRARYDAGEERNPTRKTISALIFILTVTSISWWMQYTFVGKVEDMVLSDPTGVKLALFEFMLRFAIPGALLIYMSRTILQYRLALLILGAFILWSYKHLDPSVIFEERNFFGRVSVAIDKDSNSIDLYNGECLHGAESLNPVKRGLPYFYCYPDGPIGLLKKAVCLPIQKTMKRNETGQPKDPIAVIGLGCGIAAALAEPGETAVFYEINPAVVDLASNPFYFTYLYQARKRKVDLRMVTGDGRLEIQKAPYRFYRLIISDCYSSNAIPIHMITKEAVQSYLLRLADDGALVFNITNSHYNLKPVIARLAGEFKMKAAVTNEYDRSLLGRKHNLYIDWAVLTRNERQFETLIKQGWKPLEPDLTFKIWTDDYCNPLSVLDSPRH